MKTHLGDARLTIQHNPATGLFRYRLQSVMLITATLVMGGIAF